MKSQNRFHRKSSREVFNRAEFFLIEFLVLDIAFPGFFRIGERYDRIQSTRSLILRENSVECKMGFQGFQMIN